MKRSIPGLAAMVVAAVIAPGAQRPACADGAFPDAQSVLLPRDRPNEIVLATNFGLVFSDDTGASWSYACETDDETRGGFRYVMGPPALVMDPGHLTGDRIFGVSIPGTGAPVSSDDGCTWTLGAGALDDSANPNLATDLFPDPSDPARVFVLATPDDPPGAPGSVYRSLDGGATYAGPLFTPADDPATDPGGAGRPATTGVESAASQGQIVYVTWYDRVSDRPHLATSTDGGDTWSDRDLQATLGLVKPYLVAVDPVDPGTIYLRVVTADGAADPFEGLAISRDGGSTWSVPLRIAEGALQGFVRRTNGSLAVIGATRSLDGTVETSTLFRSDDGGLTFSGAALPFHGKGLAEREGTLFLSTDDALDLVALVSSSDGETWQPRLRFQDITGLKACVFDSCRGSCQQLLASFPIFPAETCQTSRQSGASDGGGGAAGSAAGGASGLGGAGAVAGERGDSAAGCGCDAAGFIDRGTSGWPVGSWGAFALCMLARRTRLTRP